MKKVFAIALSLMLVFAACLTGCTDDSGETVITVKFDVNTTLETTNVRDRTPAKGEKLAEPTVSVIGDNPENQVIVGWYTDKECTEANKWDFEEDTVEKSMTLYAKWSARYLIQYFTGGDAPAATAYVFPGEKAERQDSLAGEFELLGYYTTPDFREGSEFDFNTAIQANTDLYLKLNRGKVTITPVMLANADFSDSIAVAGGTPLVMPEVKTAEDGSYAEFNFGSIKTGDPFFRLNNLNIGISETQILTFRYKNLGAGRTLRVYYVVCYNVVNQEYSQGGNFGLYKDVAIESNMSAEDDWAEVSVDMGAASISPEDGISEWGRAELLSHLRIDYPDGVMDEQTVVDDPDCRLLQLESIQLTKSDVDYSPKDTLSFDEGYTESASVDFGGYTWTAQEGAVLYAKGSEGVTAYFPYGGTANTLTASVKSGSEIDLDQNKALTIECDNMGYGNELTVAWTSDDNGTEASGSVTITGMSAKKENTLYKKMSGDPNWKGKLKTLTLTYKLKGVDNAFTVTGLEIASPAVNQVNGYDFSSLLNGFEGAVWENEAMKLTGTGAAVLTAEADGTVLNFDLAELYRGFTFYYRNAGAADQLKVTWKGQNGEKSALVGIESNMSEYGKVSLNVLDVADNGFAGKISELKLEAVGAGAEDALYLSKIEFDFRQAYLDCKAESPNDGCWASAIASRDWKGAVEFNYDEVMSAWKLSYALNATFNGFLTNGVALAGTQRKIYLVYNNATENTSLNVYSWFTSSAAAGGAPDGKWLKQPSIKQSMKAGEWAVVEIDYSSFEDITDSMYLNGIRFEGSNPAMTGDIWIRAIVVL